MPPSCNLTLVGQNCSSATNGQGEMPQVVTPIWVVPCSTGFMLRLDVEKRRISFVTPEPRAWRRMETKNAFMNAHVQSMYFMRLLCAVLLWGGIGKQPYARPCCWT